MDTTVKKRGGRRLHTALTDRAVKAATESGRMFDGQGLFLLVTPGGAKIWKQRITVKGRRQELGLGPYPVVTLAKAREVALENRRMVREGLSPKSSGAEPVGPRRYPFENIDLAGAPAWTRTRGPSIKSRMLYQLSYGRTGARKLGRPWHRVKRTPLVPWDFPPSALGVRRCRRRVPCWPSLTRRCMTDTMPSNYFEK